MGPWDRMPEAAREQIGAAVLGRFIGSANVEDFDYADVESAVETIHEEMRNAVGLGVDPRRVLENYGVGTEIWDQYAINQVESDGSTEQDTGASPAPEGTLAIDPMVPVQVAVNQSAAPSRLPHLTAEDLANWRRRIVQALRRLDQTDDRPPQESVAGQISRLSRKGVIPRSIAPMLRTITEMRNATEYESKTLSERENQAAHATWLAIQEWASKQGLQI